MTEAERLAQQAEQIGDLFDDQIEALGHELANELRRLSAELEAAQKQMQAQKDEWLSWQAKRRSLEVAAIELEALKKAISDAQPVAWRDPSNKEVSQSVTFSNNLASKFPHIYSQSLYTLKGIK